MIGNCKSEFGNEKKTLFFYNRLHVIVENESGRTMGIVAPKLQPNVFCQREEEKEKVREREKKSAMLEPRYDEMLMTIVSVVMTDCEVYNDINQRKYDAAR